MPNPFKPTAGKMPPILIGREDIVDDFTDALENGAGAPGRLMLISGQRGFGKTVMLTELGRTALAHGWEVFAETAAPGMVERLVAALNGSGRRLGRASIAPSVSIGGVASVSLGGIEVTGSGAALTLRESIEARLARLPRGKGILFTIDETQAARIEELADIAIAVQHAIGDEDLKDLADDEKQGIAFAFAGLPALVDEVASNKLLTFLRRAMFYELEGVPLPDVRNAYVASAFDSGKTISRECAEAAARATMGNPYMVQLVGYYMWQAAHARRSKTIEEDDVELGIADAKSQFPNAVCAPSYRALAHAQQAFLRAMAPDFPGASSLSDIAERAGKSMSWAGKYRASLERAKMIETVGWGQVAYSIPYFGEWIRKAF